MTTKLFVLLNSSGGDKVICLAVIVLGLVCSSMGIPHAHELTVGASGALFMAMRAPKQ